MTKMTVTWLGEDEAYFEVLYDKDGNETGTRPAPGPSFTYFGDLRFDKDKPVTLDNEAPGLTAEQRMVVDNLIKRAPNMNKRFKVGEPVAEKQPEKKPEKQSYER